MVFEHKSDVGRLREENQDSCDAFCIGDTFFGVVADGMGGYKGGSIASSIAVEAVRQRIEAEYDEQMRESELLSLLQSCFVSANSDILQRSIKDAELSGMGTTMVLAAVRQGRALALNVGDSRAYFVSGGEIRQLTKDQSYVQHLVDIGEITPQEALKHPQRNIIMQAVGVSTAVSPDVYTFDYNGETLLLCSDGLTNMVSDDAIAAVCGQADSCEEKVRRLIGMANEAGGTDNISVVLLQYNSKSAGDKHE